MAKEITKVGENTESKRNTVSHVLTR